jgi:hypothetical protein
MKVRQTEENEIVMKLSVRGARAAAAVTLAGGLAVAGLLAQAGTTAGADPYTAPNAAPLVGVGSNTIQDLFDAYAGAAPTAHNVDAQTTKYYTPLADPATGVQVESWSAADPHDLSTGGCVSTKYGGNTFARPNGSGDGLRALSDELGGVAWSKVQTGSCASTTISIHQIDFFRSSSAPSGTAGTGGITWIDFSHDALAYAYSAQNGLGAAAVTNLTTGAGALTQAQLGTVFNVPLGNGTVTPTGLLQPADAASPTGKDVVMPAYIQDGSGTDKTWLGFLGDSGNATNGAGFTTQFNLEENSADALINNLAANVATFLTDDVLPANTPVLVVEGFSVGAWISEANTVALDRSSAGRAGGVDLGEIGAYNVANPGASQVKPYTGTPGTEAPVAAYYSGPFGRDLYLGLPYIVLNGSISQKVPAAIAIFGNGANPAGGQLCAAGPQGELAAFGFIPLSAVSGGTTTCGQETNTVTTTGQGS